MKQFKSLCLLIALVLINSSITLAQKDDIEYPGYYTPTNNIRNIKAFPAPLLSIDGEYGIWHKTGFKIVADSGRITRPFIICEGFDAANNLEFDDLFEQLNQNSFIERDNKRSVSKFKTINNLL